MIPRRLVASPQVRWLLAAALVGFVAVLARVLVESKVAFDRGEQLLERGDAEAAVFHFRAAAKWYAPGNPWVPDALDQLMAIASAAEDRGDWVFALHAWDSARAAILGTRSFYTPNTDRLGVIDARLPDVMARAREVHPNGPRSRPDQRDELRERFAKDVQVDHAPDPMWSTVSSLGFLLWIGAMFTAIWTGAPEAGGTRRKWVGWSVASAAGFALWVGGLAAL